MLTESFVASIQLSGNNKQPPPSGLKDVGIFFHEYQPRPGLQASFKKSSTRSNSLAVTASHVFAAQVDKSVVNVYSRRKGNQEATVPFPERVHSVAIAGEAGGGVLVLGTEGGRLILWELCTGRSISTTASHLQPTTCLAVDPSSNFILSGSGDSNIHVWSLAKLLSFSHSSSSGSSEPLPNSPIRTLSNHRNAVTAIAVSHSGARTNIAISGSQDQRALVWDYHRGILLRTILLPSTPLCLTIDPASRAFYAGYDDGSVQLIDFFRRPSTQNTLYDTTQQSTPAQSTSKDLWTPPSSDIGATQCLALSYDGTTLLSGHQNGKVLAWDVAKGRFLSNVAELLQPVTNLLMLPPLGFLNAEQPRLTVHTVVRPRPDPQRSANNNALHLVPASYSFQAQICSPPSSTLRISEFQYALQHPSIPTSVLEEGLTELSAFYTTDDATSAQPYPSDSTYTTTRIATLEAELSSLRAQAVEQEASHLRTEKKRLEASRARQVRKAERAQKRREAWHVAESKKRGSGDQAVDEVTMRDGGDTSSSDGEDA